MPNVFLPKLIVILGPTASGKSDLAVEIAKKFHGEIISADSRQVYRGMDIGTGKVPRDKIFNFQISISNKIPKSKFQISNKPYLYKGIRHYLLDVTNPKRRFTAAQYKKMAEKAIKDILKRGKIPIICGGTGFYIQALTENLQIPAVKPDLKLRAKLEKIATKELYEKLQKLDPQRAKNIDRFNKRRLIRAIEIVLKTGRPVPLLKSPLTPPKGGESLPPFREGWGEFDTLFIGVKKSPAELKKLIHKRLFKRLKQGMIKEVQNLRATGLSWKRLDSFGLEYRWIARFLRKIIGREEMVLRLQKDIEHFAKRQIVWFKKYAAQTHWVNNKKEAVKLASDFLKKS